MASVQLRKSWLLCIGSMHSVVYSYTCRCKQKHNETMMNFNEWTNTLLYKNIPLTLYSWKGCERVDIGYVCVRGELEMGTACHILTQSSSDHSSTSSSFCWAAQLWVTEGPSPLFEAGSHSCILSPTDSNSNCNSNSLLKLSQAVAPGYIIVWRPPVSCGRTHLHRIQPRPQAKVIFRYLWRDAPVSAVPLLIYTSASLDWQLGQGSICNNSLFKIPRKFSVIKKGLFFNQSFFSTDSVFWSLCLKSGIYK